MMIRLGSPLLALACLLTASLEAQGTADTIPYDIVERNDVSYPGSRRMTYRVVLDVREIPRDDQMCRVVLSIWQDGNRHWNEFTVWLYLPGLNTKSLAFVTAEFRPSGLIQFIVEPGALWDTKWQDMERPQGRGCES